MLYSSSARSSCKCINWNWPWNGTTHNYTTTGILLNRLANFWVNLAWVNNDCTVVVNWANSSCGVGVDWVNEHCARVAAWINYSCGVRVDWVREYCAGVRVDWVREYCAGVRVDWVNKHCARVGIWINNYWRRVVNVSISCKTEGNFRQKWNQG